MEILIVMGMVSFFLMLGNLWLKGMNNAKASKETLEKVKVFQEAIRRNFFSNLQYVEQNCYGWNDPTCSVLTLTPVIVNSNTLQFNTYNLDILSLFQRIGCSITGTVPNFSVQCYDGRGRLFSFTDVNAHNFRVPYTVPYQNNSDANYYVLRITDSLGHTYAVDLAKEMLWALSNSSEKLTDIGNAIKSYVRNKRILELTNVCGTNSTSSQDPAGGLLSSDDALVPWIWQALTQPSTVLCSGVEDTANGCGCLNFSNTSVWSQDRAMCDLDSRSELLSFLSNLNLGNRYLTDGFGNGIDVVPLADNNGNPISNCPPPRPSEFYQSIGVPKTRVGVKGSSGNWVYYIDVINE